MNNRQRALYTSEQVKALDSFAIATLRDGYELMCTAGAAGLEVLLNVWPQANDISIFCGLGNNAGDGYVLARLAKAKQKNVSTYQVGEVDESKLSNEAKQARQDWLAAGGQIVPYLNQDIDADVLVDALVGTGTRLPLPEIFTKAIHAMNISGCPILALDLPSGVCPNTGIVMNEAIRAQATISFIGRKIGLATNDALDHIGELYFNDLNVPRAILKQVEPKAYAFDYEDMQEFIVKRPLNTHKGKQGHVLVIGAGEIQYSGAVCLSGEAALRSGCGLVSVAVASESMPLMARAAKEIMCYAVAKSKQLASLFERVNAIVIGPGLAQTSWSNKILKYALTQKRPMVVDADGLNLLAQQPCRNSQWILTPHPKEAARLLGVDVTTIQGDRISAAQKIVEKFGGVCVLKGAGTIVANEQGEVAICPQGVSALATSGTGDVLAGMIGALLAQGLLPMSAALLAVSTLVEAGLIESTFGHNGMLASDLFLHIRGLLNPKSTL